jgi:hypothetical protein
MSADQEYERMVLEDTMALIVGARKRLELVALRAEQASRSQPELMRPACEDLKVAAKKLNTAQKTLSQLWNQEVWK